MKVVRYTAAGAVVIDGDRVLVLYRPARGEVRLPKGHVENGEEISAAALRETTEEAGFDALEIIADLGEQTVEFDLPPLDGESRRCVRTERFFLVRLMAQTTIERPAGDAAQFEPRWHSFAEAERLMTYVAEREWIRRARIAAGEVASS